MSWDLLGDKQRSVLVCHRSLVFIPMGTRRNKSDDFANLYFESPDRNTLLLCCLAWRDIFTIVSETARKRTVAVQLPVRRRCRAADSGRDREQLAKHRKLFSVKGGNWTEGEETVINIFLLSNRTGRDPKRPCSPWRERFLWRSRASAANFGSFGFCCEVVCNFLRVSYPHVISHYHEGLLMKLDMLAVNDSPKHFSCGAAFLVVCLTGSVL